MPETHRGKASAGDSTFRTGVALGAEGECGFLSFISIKVNKHKVGAFVDSGSWEQGWKFPSVLFCVLEILGGYGGTKDLRATHGELT